MTKPDLKTTGSKKSYNTPILQQIGKIPTVTQTSHNGSSKDGGSGGSHKIPPPS